MTDSSESPRTDPLPDWGAIYKTLDWCEPVEGEAEPGVWHTETKLPDGRRLSVFMMPGEGFLALADGERWSTTPVRAVELLIAASRLAEREPSEEAIKAVFAELGCCDGGDQCESSRMPGQWRMDDCCRHKYRRVLEIGYAVDRLPSSQPPLLDERYWCGCVRTARWTRCKRHGELEHDEEPPTQREDAAASPTTRTVPGEPPAGEPGGEEI